MIEWQYYVYYLYVIHLLSNFPIKGGDIYVNFIIDIWSHSLNRKHDEKKKIEVILYPEEINVQPFSVVWSLQKITERRILQSELNKDKLDQSYPTEQVLFCFCFLISLVGFYCVFKNLNGKQKFEIYDSDCSEDFMNMGMKQCRYHWW